MEGDPLTLECVVEGKQQTCLTWHLLFFNH